MYNVFDYEIKVMYGSHVWTIFGTRVKLSYYSKFVESSCTKKILSRKQNRTWYPLTRKTTLADLRLIDLQLNTEEHVSEIGTKQ